MFDLDAHTIGAICTLVCWIAIIVLLNLINKE